MMVRAQIRDGRSVSACRLDGLADCCRVLPSIGLDVPAERFEAGSDILAEGDVGAGGEGDVVLVVEVDQLAELEIAGDGGRFEGDAFHDIAVGDDAIGVVIDDFVTRTIEGCGEEPLGDGKADPVGEALTQWSGGDFDARSVSRVPGGRAFWSQAGERPRGPRPRGRSQ